jgi:hypothetical protein
MVIPSAMSFQRTVPADGPDRIPAGDRPINTPLPMASRDKPASTGAVSSSYAGSRTI